MENEFCPAPLHPPADVTLVWLGQTPGMSSTRTRIGRMPMCCASPTVNVHRVFQVFFQTVGAAHVPGVAMICPPTPSPVLGTLVHAAPISWGWNGMVCTALPL